MLRQEKPRASGGLTRGRFARFAGMGNKRAYRLNATNAELFPLHELFSGLPKRARLAAAASVDLQYLAPGVPAQQRQRHCRHFRPPLQAHGRIRHSSVPILKRLASG